MMQLWNDKCTPPPLKFFEKYRITSKIKKSLCTAIAEVYETTVKGNLMTLEGVMLSNLVRYTKHNYRSDKGFIILKKVQKGIESLCKLDMDAILSLIHLGVKDNGIPSREWIQFLLVRLQSYGKLLFRINSCSQHAGCALFHRLSTGHKWNDTITCIAVVTRIWHLSRYIFEIVCQNYKHILDTLNFLPSTDKQWLPETYTFPERMDVWINERMTLLDNSYPFNETSSCIDFTQKQDSETEHEKASDNYYKALDVDSNPVWEEFLKLASDTRKTTARIKQFIVKEEKYRQIGKKEQCLTKNFDELRFFMFRKQIFKFCKRMDEKQMTLKMRRKMSVKLIELVQQWLS